jgi:hypothetical protein
VYAEYLPKVSVHYDQVKKNKENWNLIIADWQKLLEDGNDLVKKFIEFEEEEQKVEELENDDELNKDENTADS